MCSIIIEMDSLQQADARRHIRDVHWEAMVLLDIPHQYHYHKHLSDIKSLNWDLEPVKVSSPVVHDFLKILVKRAHVDRGAGRGQLGLEPHQAPRASAVSKGAAGYYRVWVLAEVVVRCL
ncbi:uncharacterized protein EV420DRAFT_1478726 [Desarmillaria tabescens]|uniref:Uncharacterized protein n=1 Tax=Armillaria tabescens TaxID=1929756 RepID=A0AA39N7A3_ARMTA|nr:uncharacterized protein EV420DRAFT_1478726 [Desarmillaria tabescens]KAK0460204.1 hypothetical protein EV420DRAFT_1478726 [Desarmillaria tabescens]